MSSEGFHAHFERWADQHANVRDMEGYRRLARSMVDRGKHEPYDNDKNFTTC